MNTPAPHSASVRAVTGAPREQRVELIELFYDLIYVYAISRMTLLIEEPEHGVIAPDAFFAYIVVSCAVIQAWLYMTNYVNRYGTWTWWEYLFAAVNMMATVYMVNSISPASRWDGIAGTWNLSLIIALSCVWAMYFIRLRMGCRDTNAARNSCMILTIVIALYTVTCIGAFHHVHWMIVWLGSLATITGMFLPFAIRGHFDASIISFPHLAERFELLTIITFGEGVVGMTSYFDVHHLTVQPALVFALILLMFGCYVIQLHVLCEHHRVSRSLRLMFSHYFIVISINLVTVALGLLHNSEANRMFVAVLAIVSLALFFAAIYSDSTYYRADVHFTARDGVLCALWLAVGGAMMVLLRNGDVGVLCGMLVAVGGNFAMLAAKALRCTEAEQIADGRA